MERLQSKELLDWYNDEYRKPLVIWGARQVGKTYLITELFAKKYFKDYVYIDLAKDDDALSFFSSTCNADKYLTYIETRFSKQISPKVPLIFDEVQMCPQVLTSLKYFCQDHRELPIIATGSMVRLSLQHFESEKEKDKFLFPVGKIDSLTMYPLTFEEYLLNVNPNLLDMIKKAYSKKEALDPTFHKLAMDILHEYLVIGGFPEALDVYINTKSYVKATKTLDSIYNNYLGDMELYSVSKETILKTRNLYQNIFNQLNKENKNFKISLIDSGKSNRDYFNAYQWLELAHVIYKSKNIKGQVPVPFIEKEEGLFRLYLSDSGLFTFQSKVPQSNFFVNNSRNNLSGVFYENYVACELVAKGIPLYYWTGKKNHEFEFVVYSNGKVYPIDAKKNKGNLNSLDEFRQSNPKSTGIKISSNNFGYNKENDILTIPHYAVSLLANDIKEGKDLI